MVCPGRFCTAHILAVVDLGSVAVFLKRIGKRGAELVSVSWHEQVLACSTPGCINKKSVKHSVEENILWVP